MAASTSAPLDTNYNVFINYLGADVGKTFVSYLYCRLLSLGMRVFPDPHELQEGEADYVISQREGIIQTASLHIAIFSGRYAESKCCLNELVLMLESGTLIFPVFYHVSPADLRWTQGKYGLYAHALQKLEIKKTHDSTTIEKWRNALFRVSGISGFDLEGFHGDEGMLLERVVDDVLKSMKTHLNVAEYPTGLDEKVEEFESTVLSELHSPKINVVCIVGMCGVGKTTLAKELFNRKSSKYMKSYFLFNVREKSLISLQSELFRGLFQLDMRIDNIYEGIEMLRRHVSSSKVLLVLDDVDHVDQLDALFPVDVFTDDSLILITSRDKNVPVRSWVQVSSVYNLTGLNIQHSVELFCWHAFRQPHPKSGFEYLVQKFSRACSGLPLSLKVFGGLLYGNTDKDHWDSIQSMLPLEIQQNLRVDFDSLDSEEKEVFLDIACFFIGQDRDTAIRIWNGSGWEGLFCFRALQDKYLVEVDNENKIRMHSHLRQMGRDLAKVQKPLRLWSGTKDSDILLRKFRNKPLVRGVKLLPSEYENFSCARGLQLLDVEGVVPVELFLERVQSPNLIWLRWNKCPYSSLPSWVPMTNLRVLQVCGRELDTLWRAEWQAPVQLRELEIVASLSNIPKSIGLLKHLERIVVTCSPLQWGNNIEELPEEFCLLRSLKALALKGCSKMRSLPESLGNLTNLLYIDLSHLDSLERLPYSFRNLIKLKHLHLNGCLNLTISEDVVGYISTLENIEITGCDKIEELPLQVAHQRFLKKLNLELRNLKELPSAIGELSYLEKLVLKCPLLETLPPSLGDLMNLNYLELRICQKLKCLPDSVRQLNQLTTLTVNNCRLRQLPFEKVEGEKMTLTGSEGPNTVSNTDSSIEKCMLRLQLIELFKTQISEVSFAEGVCPNLRHLNIWACHDLVKVGTLPNTLLKLQLTDCRNLRKIDGLCGLAKLQLLDISRCSGVEELPSIETLVSLEALWASECVKLKCIQGFDQLAKLKFLHISWCCQIEELVGVDQLKSLEVLYAYRCIKLKSITGVAQLTKLRILDVSECFVLEELPGVENLLSLQELWASKCLRLKNLPGLAQLTKLRILNISDCSQLEEMTGVEHLKSLEELRASGCRKLKSIRGLGQLTKLLILIVFDSSEMQVLEGVEHSKSLEKLNAYGCLKLQWGRGVVEQLRRRHLKELYL